MKHCFVLLLQKFNMPLAQLTKKWGKRQVNGNEMGTVDMQMQELLLLDASKFENLKEMDRLEHVQSA